MNYAATQRLRERPRGVTRAIAPARSAPATAAASSSTRRRTRRATCRCRAGAHRRARGRARSTAGIPKRYRGVSFDRPPVADMRPRADQCARCAATSRDVDDEPRRGPRAVDAWATSARARRRSRCSSPRPRSTPGARSRSTRCRGCWPAPRDLSMTARALLRSTSSTASPRRPAAHRRPRRREPTDWVLEQLYSIVNARYEDERAIIVDHQPDARRAARADRRAHRLAAGRDLRRPAPAVRRTTRRMDRARRPSAAHAARARSDSTRACQES